MGLVYIFAISGSVALWMLACVVYMKVLGDRERVELYEFYTRASDDAISTYEHARKTQVWHQM